MAPCYLSPLISYYSPLCFFCSSSTGFLLLLEHTKHNPSSGPLHLLFSLPRVIFPQMSAWFTPSPPLRVDLYVTSVKTLLTYLRRTSHLTSSSAFPYLVFTTVTWKLSQPSYQCSSSQTCFKSQNPFTLLKIIEDPQRAFVYVSFICQYLLY